MVSYLSENEFRFKITPEISENFTIKSGVLEGSVIDSFLCVIYTSDLLTTKGNTIGTFAINTIDLAAKADSVEALRRL